MGILCTSTNITEIRKLDKNHIRGLRIGFKTQGKIEDVDLFNLANIVSCLILLSRFELCKI